MDQKELSDADTACEAVGPFEILRSPERIAVIRALRDHGTPMSLQSLAAHLDGDDTPVVGGFACASTDEFALHHRHLPYLEAAGVLRYDDERRVVTAFDGQRVSLLVESGRRVLSALQANRLRLLEGTGRDEERLQSLLDAGRHVLDSLGDDPDDPETDPPHEAVRLPATIVQLTPTQRALLAGAREEGYFETPRGVTLEELAEQHDCSLVEASRELRAALDAVLAAVDFDP